MNEKNFDYLKDQVKFTGFGQELESQLKANLAKSQTEFQLKHTTAYGKDELSSVLQFKKSNQTDMFFFNSYTASLKKENEQKAIEQKFYINKEAGNITQKEAYNLLNGRAVNKDLTNKDGKLYNAWVQLDFKEADPSGNYKVKQFSEKYGFELEKALSKHPIKELGNDTDKSRLIESLQKGNRQAVTFTQDGAEQKRFIEANPQFKSVAVYDERQQRIRSTQTEKQGQGESQSQQQSENQGGKKQDVKSPENDEPARQGKRKGVSV
ncbi:hypothetical protein [Dyadobacter frigoris]|uniref:hypothetical protein n=1 Tax=Dyadobacter frigoris TaxID=2576211 RepID=UPI0015F2D040|nr:hypothetical protein [Dyadobacter frigoris]